ncbi:BadF/BadG/BcrA/BcrD ATPase family protein [Streptomyces sp. TRM 70351]|uniref:N-acetylglucosamine kinase n=1 Tax=Streptomyces sp. TRM 70351 TaxID=3116552 RepID=UPI002E7C2E52|nr:BadF/BadG/BcrA/BcrD ATPase family protein [Streptomyces sp. TRM 70351]MEE1927236.1 BadF/BadG/BcrA/BcrD ATPase family protein [Streptomyces sp. TRM 70351]
MTGWVLGVDSGGSGLRCALAPCAGPERASPAPRPAGRVVTGGPVRTGPGGIDAEDLLRRLLPAVRALLAEAGAVPGADPPPLRAVCVGAAGMATLGERLRAALPGALAGAFGVTRWALAADAVTAYAGALGERPGAVVAAGTGVIALGTDLRTWRRADGWGHLLGDCGGGAWIGRAGLEAALRSHDARPHGSAALRARAEAAFGPLAGLPAALYPRDDRAAVLASFAPDVAACARTDAVAEDVLRRAAGHLAGSAAAVCPGGDAALAFTGGLLRLGAPLLVPLRAELDARLPHVRLAEPAADPLGGALLIARQHAAGTLALPPDAALLRLG